MGRRRRLRALLLAGVAIAAAGLAVLLQATDAVLPAELKTVDARFDVRGTEEPPDDVVVVAIDARTFEETGEQWPFPRSMHARVVDRLRAARPRALGIDIQFTEATDVDEDNALIEAIERARGTVLATTEVDERGRTNVFGGEEVLRAIGAKAADASYRIDDDGVFRKVSRRIGTLETFGYALARAARRNRPPDAPQDPAWLDFPGPGGTFRTVSYSQVLAGRVPPATFADKVVIVGPTAVSLQDVHPTPTDPVMPGAEIQAAATSAFLHGLPLRAVPAWLELLLGAALAVLAPLAAAALRPWPARVLSLAAGALYVVAAQLLFEAGDIVPLVAPLIGLLAGVLGTLSVDLVTSAFERERLYDLFSRFVPDAVVAEVVARADDGVRLGGVARTATVMFCDLRGFTSFSEGKDPEAVIGVVNSYLGEMSEAILDHGGTLVAYMGDGIFAVFGAPLEQADHADRALAAAREMVCVRLPRFNARLREEGLDASFRMGIGLNTGRVVSGNVGSERRLEYAAIGDTTNTAARLEGLTKGTPHQLLLAEATRRALQVEPDDLVDAGSVEVRGKQGRMQVWSITAAAAPGG